MEASQEVQMEENQFMEERESPLRELNSIVVQNTVCEVVREIENEDPETLLIARELEELDLAQQREHNFQNLDSVLKRKQYVLSKAKAKEEVELCTLQNEFDETRETRKHTEKEIESLNKIKKELQVNLEIGALELLKTQKCVENTTTGLTSLKSNYENLEQFEKLIAQDITSLNADYVSLGNYYRTGKEAAIKKINANKEAIQKSRSEIAHYSLENNLQIEALQKRFEMLLKNEKEEEEALVRLNKMQDDNLKQFYNHQLELFKEELECKHLQEMIDNIDLDKVKKQKIDEKLRQDEMLDNQMKKFASAKERFEEVENFNKFLEGKLEEDQQYNEKLQERLLTLDNEKVNLMSVRQKLQDNINNASLNLKTNQALNESKMTQVAGELSQVHADIDLVSKKKDEVMQQLKSLQEDYNNSLKILESLLHLESQHQEAIQIETQKRREMEEKSLMLEYELKTSKLSLTEVKENIKTTQSLRIANSQQLANRLNKIKEKRTQVANDAENKIKTCRNERNTYEWNFEETKRDNIARNQRELCILRENIETHEQTLKENNQKIDQLRKSMLDKNEEFNSLKKEIDELKLAKLVKTTLQNSSVAENPKAPKRRNSQLSDDTFSIITLTTDDGSETEGGPNFREIFNDLETELLQLNKVKF